MSPSSVLTRPAPIAEGAHLAVLAISGPSDEARIRVATEKLRARGFRVTLADNAFLEGPRSYLAGSDATRADLLNRALADPAYDAYLFTRGGYGAMRILDAVDYELIRRNPRPIIGYSDITALHQAVAMRAGVTSFHGPMLNTDFHDGLSPAIDTWMWRALRGESPLSFEFDRAGVLVGGDTEGVLFGGCLAITTALVGTPFDYWVPDGVWFWEDVGEPLYKIDRMLTHLRLSDRFRALRGMIVGQLKECGEGRQDELVSLLLEFFGNLGIPVIHGLPFGHFGNNLMLPVGQTIQLDTRSCTLTLPGSVVQRGDA
jgi:muramoyltetrapeptide carboxypeptidase